MRCGKQDRVDSDAELLGHNMGTEKCKVKEKEECDVERCETSHSVNGEAVDDPNIVTWDSPTDPENPLNFPTWRKWILISLSSGMNFMTGLASAMFAPGVPDLMEEFNSTNDSIASFVVTIFVLGLAMGPIFFAPLSELYGRLPVQHVGCAGFLVFSIACALSSNLNMLIGMRLLQGVFAAVPLTNGGGLIADMINQESRGFAMSMFTLGILIGPIIGPVAGGFLTASKGWRWVFWVTSMVLGFLSIPSLIFWKESYTPVLLGRKAAQIRKETGNLAFISEYDTGLSPKNHFKRGIGRALKILVFSPVILSLSMHMGLVYAYFYILFTTLTPVFQDNYRFSTSTVGLSFLGVGIGFIFGQIACARLGDAIMMRLAKKGGGEMKPEYRLPLCCFGGLFVPIGLFWYGWSVQGGVHWIMPIIGTGILGCGNALIFITIQSYTIDAFTLYAASGLAGNTIVRSVMATVLPLAAPKMYQTLGLGWGNSLLAFLALTMIPIPCLLFVYGEKMRSWNLERIRNL